MCFCSVLAIPIFLRCVLFSFTRDIPFHSVLTHCIPHFNCFQIAVRLLRRICGMRKTVCGQLNKIHTRVCIHCSKMKFKFFFRFQTVLMFVYVSDTKNTSSIYFHLSFVLSAVALCDFVQASCMLFVTHLSCSASAVAISILWHVYL